MRRHLSQESRNIRVPTAISKKGQTFASLSVSVRFVVPNDLSLFEDSLAVENATIRSSQCQMIGGRATVAPRCSQAHNRRFTPASESAAQSLSSCLLRYLSRSFERRYARFNGANVSRWHHDPAPGCTPKQEPTCATFRRTAYSTEGFSSHATHPPDQVRQITR